MHLLVRNIVFYAQRCERCWFFKNPRNKEYLALENRVRSFLRPIRIAQEPSLFFFRNNWCPGIIIKHGLKTNLKTPFVIENKLTLNHLTAKVSLSGNLNDSAGQKTVREGLNERKIARM